MAIDDIITKETSEILFEFGSKPDTGIVQDSIAVGFDILEIPKNPTLPVEISYTF